MNRESFKYPAKIEYIKNIIDVFKVVITLSSGLLVVVPTLMSSVFKAPLNIELLGISVAGFVYTIIAALLTVFMLVNNMQYQDNEKYWSQNLTSPRTTIFCLFSSLVVFVLTIITLSIFIITNIFSCSLVSIIT
ncbi:TPA: hypothetical protein ACN34R_001438 [Vibrio parahaemolyticus]|nr:hypothetical protein [Vibrio parahaemolyticus]ELA6678106.1 hypothetical protein [Vibrio parahaemolyticus]ELI6470034.1 hypothetical protein [Vibrio parahaemolyticus]MBE4035255.1 hypothetical protein [Vibrio parahaemolyticus]